MVDKYQSTEHMEQVGFLTWWKYKFPSILIFHIPNGEYRSITTAQKLKKAGVVPGVPDMYCPKLHLWIEMKRKDGGTLSKDQKEIIEYLTKIGDTVIIGYGAEDASRKVLEIINRNT